MKKQQLNNTQIKNMIIQRLELQSTQRNLSIYKLKQNNLNYFESPEFFKIFNNWDENRKKNFLKDVGGEYWTRFGDIITNKQ